MRIALFQCRPQGGDTARARTMLDDAARNARAGGATLLVLPEMAMTGYNIGAETIAALAQPPDGPLMNAVAQCAAGHNIALAAGYPERGEDDAIYNAVQIVDRAGRPLASYRKTHLYGDVDRAQFSAGGKLPEPFALGGWRTGLAICYDIEFPELARSHALAGVDLLVVPTANMAPFDSVATRIVPTRAEENGIFIAYANYCGREGDFDYCGLSCIVGPGGEDLARAGRDEEMIFADISKAALAGIRNRQNYLKDRRPQLYSHE